MKSKLSLYEEIDDLAAELTASNNRVAQLEYELARPERSTVKVCSEPTIPMNVAVAVETVALMLEDRANNLAIRKGQDITAYEEAVIQVHDLRGWLRTITMHGYTYCGNSLDVDSVFVEANELWEVLTS